MNVTVMQNFFDGNLADAFKKLGYPAQWKAGEFRNIPDELAKKVVVSGGVITFPETGAKESRIVEVAEPNIPDAQKVITSRNKTEPSATVVFPEGFTDGNLSEECAAIGHPASFGVGEIVKLPKTLLEKIIISGGLVETNPEIIGQYAKQQAKHEVVIREWQADRDAQVLRVTTRQENALHNKKLLEEIEKLSGQALSATGKTYEAIWQRISRLQSQLR